VGFSDSDVGWGKVRARRPLSGALPLPVEIDLAVEQCQRLLPVGDGALNALAVRLQHGLARGERGPALAHQRRVAPHLGDRHAGAAQPLHQLQPRDVALGIHAPAAAGA